MRTKEELRRYLAADKRALRVPERRRHPRLWNDEIWKFEIFLRKREYYTDCGGRLRYLPLAYYSWRCFRLGVRLGYSIPIHVFGPGLSIAHRGTIVVNGNARVGAFCRLQECTTLGATGGSAEAPRLGNFVFLGSGARVIGGVEIADGVAVGAGAVVIRSCTEPNVTLAGVPARIVSRNGSAGMIPRELNHGEAGV